MNDQERYEQIDMPFYKNEIAPLLPPQVLDFHTHVWTKDLWNEVHFESDKPGGKYMVTQVDYGTESLLADGKRMFPDRPYKAVCFGNPTPGVNADKTLDYTVKAGENPQLYPLVLAGRSLHPAQRLAPVIENERVFGYKVFLNWLGNDYGDIKVDDMISPEQMELANRNKLIVLLHVPRSGRLADPVVQDGVRKLSREYPDAQIVLAHCGRAFMPTEMKLAIDSIVDLPNVYMDTSMVMDPTALQMVFEHIDSSRVLYATDLPVAAMRGRRVYVMDHWVDLVLADNSESAFRVCSDNMNATFMSYEIIRALRMAADMAGLTDEQFKGVFHDNGMAVLDRVKS